MRKSIFSKVVNRETGRDSNNVGNENLSDVDNVEVAVALASVAVSESEAEVLRGELDGQTIQQEMDAVVDGAARIDTALEAIASTAVGFDSKPSLSGDSLAILDATILNEFGVNTVSNESNSNLGPIELTEELVLGLEALGGDAWKSFKEMVFKFLDWVAKQYNAIFGGFERTKAKAKAIKAKEDKFEGTLSKDRVKVKVADLAMGKAGKDVASDLEAGIKALGDFATAKCDEIEKAAETVVEKIGDALDADADKWKSGEGDASKDSAPAEVTTAYTALVTATKKVSGDILGGRSIKSLDGTSDEGVETTPGKADSFDDVAKLKIDMEAPGKNLEKDEAAPLERDKIAGVCDQVIETCDDLINGRKKIADTKKFKSQFEKMAKTAEQKAKDDDFKKLAAVVKKAGNAAATIGMIANGNIRVRLSAHTGKVMNTALSYAEKSLKKA